MLIQNASAASFCVTSCADTYTQELFPDSRQNGSTSPVCSDCHLTKFSLLFADGFLNTKPVILQGEIELNSMSFTSTEIIQDDENLDIESIIKTNILLVGNINISPCYVPHVQLSELHA